MRNNIPPLCTEKHTAAFLLVVGLGMVLIQCEFKKSKQNGISDAIIQKATDREYTLLAEVLTKLQKAEEVAPDDIKEALIQATKLGDAAIVKVLIDLKGIKATDKNGDTLLHVAAQNGHKGISELLIEEGANVNTEDEDGHTPLHFAALKGHRDIKKLSSY